MNARTGTYVNQITSLLNNRLTEMDIAKVSIYDFNSNLIFDFFFPDD